LEYVPTLVEGFEITDKGDGLEPSDRIARSVESQAPDVSELSEVQSRSYSLTSDMAGKLKIQVAELSASRSSSVSVLEWSKHKDIQQDDGSIHRWGCAARFCVSVNKMQGQGSMALPFLAAEAQLGKIEAQWTMQLRGVSGEKIEKLVLPPSPLDVETYVVANQAMSQIAATFHDDTTVLKPMFLHRLETRSGDEQHRDAALRTFILSGMAHGRSVAYISARLPQGSEKVLQEMLSALNAAGEPIPEEVRQKARAIMADLDFQSLPRSFWSW
jgi:hypothetical protein